MPKICTDEYTLTNLKRHYGRLRPFLVRYFVCTVYKPARAPPILTFTDVNSVEIHWIISEVNGKIL